MSAPVQAALEAVRAFPRGACRRRYASEIARLTLSGARAHGERVRATDLPEPKAERIRIAIDAAIDRERCAGLAVGDRITVRCYDDDAWRPGVIESFCFGASAPVTVRVDYPDGFTDGEGFEPINPSNYRLERILAAQAGTS